MGRIMAQTPSNRDIWRMPYIVGLLVGAAISLLPLFGLFIGIGDWHSRFVTNHVVSYANSEINPRIANLERSVMQIEKEQTKIFEMIEKQDYTRNRQYGELKSLLSDNKEDTKKIINHLLVNK